MRVQEGTCLDMALSLKESQAVVGLADLLYSFLPGSGPQAWKGHVSFRTVAEKSGVGDFWQSGSKLPMIIALLERTLEYQRRRFEPLILEIVRSGIIYRHKQGHPVKPEEIDILNGLLVEVGFKFPDLWDSKFYESLRGGGSWSARIVGWIAAGACLSAGTRQCAPIWGFRHLVLID